MEKTFWQFLYWIQVSPFQTINITSSQKKYIGKVKKKIL